MKKYQIIYADPPWSYKNKNTGGSMKSGAIAKYPTMTINEICDLPIADIADKNSVLFLWATVPLMPEAFKVMEAWGYKYKTMLTWRKIMSLGMGFWFRGQTEHLLMGVKGKVKAFRIQKANFIQCKAGTHSTKPVEFRSLIDMTELSPKIELFARSEHEGWDVWGNEVESDITLENKLT
jgi:N6-adenosine-specific RNA methylase IME4